MDWNVILGAGACVATVIGVNIALFLHIDGKFANFLTVFNNEVKDFHGRLCKIEERLVIKKEEKGNALDENRGT